LSAAGRTRNTNCWKRVSTSHRVRNDIGAVYRRHPGEKASAFSVKEQRFNP